MSSWKRQFDTPSYTQALTRPLVEGAPQELGPPESEARSSESSRSKDIRARRLQNYYHKRPRLGAFKIRRRLAIRAARFVPEADFQFTAWG
jgi:hypothetical protein